MEKAYFKKKHIGRRLLTVFFASLILLLLNMAAYGHGGKDHGNGEFTPLAALQKGVQLYDRLVEKGKLDDSWETGLVKAEVKIRHQGEAKEFIVSFERSRGKPEKVYIFFSETGKYVGSNFTGK